MWPPIPPMQFNTNYFHQPPPVTTSRRRTFESTDMITDEQQPSSSSSAVKRTRVDWEHAHLPQPPSFFPPTPTSHIPVSSNSMQLSPPNRSIHQTALNVISPTCTFQQNNFTNLNNSSPATSSRTSSPNKPLFEIFQRKTPPKQPKSEMDVEPIPNPSHQTTQQAAQQCWSCLKSCSTQPNLRLAACNYCEHRCCVDSCLIHCEQCSQLYCVRCYMTDYSNQIYERKLCVDCYYYKQ
jgi:hypothetical protein